jgi:hypothetical protein
MARIRIMAVLPAGPAEDLPLLILLLGVLGLARSG